MSDLRDLARDLGDAARNAPAAADHAVHGAALHVVESQGIGAGDVVALYPGPGSAHLGGIDADATNPETVGTSSLADVDVDELGGHLSGHLLDAGVRMVLGGKP